MTHPEEQDLDQILFRASTKTAAANRQRERDDLKIKTDEWERSNTVTICPAVEFSYSDSHAEMNRQQRERKARQNAEKAKGEQ